MSEAYNLLLTGDIWGALRNALESQMGYWVWVLCVSALVITIYIITSSLSMTAFSLFLGNLVLYLLDTLKVIPAFFGILIVLITIMVFEIFVKKGSDVII